MTKERPIIVCLCGSTRFYDAFQKANYDETMKGNIVLSVGFYPHNDKHGEGVGHNSKEKEKLDELHKRKIDLADEILVLDLPAQVCPKCRSVYAKRLGVAMTLTVQKCSCLEDIAKIPHLPYIGESTRSEIDYAQTHGKRIRFLSKEQT